MSKSDRIDRLRLPVITSRVDGEHRDYFLQADFPLLIRPNPLNPVLDNLRVDHPGPMDGSFESARQVESLQRIARFRPSADGNNPYMHLLYRQRFTHGPCDLQLRASSA